MFSKFYFTLLIIIFAVAQSLFTVSGQNYGQWTYLVDLHGANGTILTVGPSPNGGDVDFWICQPTGQNYYLRSWGWSVVGSDVTIYVDVPRLKALVKVNLISRIGHADLIFDQEIFTVDDQFVALNQNCSIGVPTDLGESHAPIPGGSPGIDPPPVVPFAVNASGNPVSGCAPLLVVVSVSANRNPVVFSWTDNGLPVGAGASVRLTYTTAGTHQIQVVGVFETETAQATLLLTVLPPKNITPPPPCVKNCGG